MAKAAEITLTPTRESTRVTLPFPPDLYEALMAAAAADMRSTTGQALYLIRQGLHARQMAQGPLLPGEERV